MRGLVLVVALFTSGFAHADLLENPESTNLVPNEKGILGKALLDGEAMRANAEAARTRGLQILSSAFEPSNRNELIAMTQKGLAAAKLEVPPPGKNYMPCMTGALAFVMRNDLGRIYVCAQLVEETLPADIVAQILIHEGAHTAGFDDECAASVIELAAMNLSGVGVKIESDYLKRCGLKD